ncbi:FAD/NAD(P)-binding domain-containing protein [Aspergillus steynii IBT 23096]|uniref:FAD/NAD(P)-binding domain-containing protein n=1 Tax=Aspergillus steynii IBT 23096 TaxID=1392250 RepID=A0A2I2GMG3_9EURO|nr:FAD/NAD(P)-binding domain-containing protein [Aspergillus steynii IBT 23096]PLB54078.1 FAD/NAD(P)-binding domain-containing protein [Aspergillus steynii IBT 23096]
MPSDQPSKLRVAVIGAGPAGLGAAIEFQKLPFVDLQVYEQAKELREVGAGISIQRNTWRMLEALGVYDNIDPNNIYRSPDGHSVQHRNGRTGELLISNEQEGTPPRYKHARALRSILQQALLKAVDQSRLRLASRLAKVTELPSGRLSLSFEDGHADEVDLVVGADGVRSVVRKHAFPDHRISYTGTTAYRGLVNTQEILSIKGFHDAVTFWHGPTRWVYTCNLNNNIYEVTARTDLPEDENTVSWGQDANIDDIRDRYEEFSPVLKEVLGKVKKVKKFALFAGPRLAKVVSGNGIALVGDASHPLSGAFGAGAGFALEDVYVLTQAVKWAYERGYPIRDALEIYDRVRSPHYEAMYIILNKFAQSNAAIRSAATFDDAVTISVESKWADQYGWLYHYDVKEVWKRAYEEEDARREKQESSSRL